MNRENISSVFGFLSIISWLCAQLPQLYTNYIHASVDGLAFPFLVSWLLGDVTNLLGCILTNQLPFQTNLAAYFVLVDVGLMGQYIYYTSKNGSKQLPPLNSANPHLHSHSRSHSRRNETWPRNSSKAIRSSSRKKHALANGVAVTGSTMEGSWMSETRGRSKPRETRTLPSHDNPSYPSSAQTSYPNSTHYEESPPSPSVALPERGRTLVRPSPLEVITGSPSTQFALPNHYESEASDDGNFAERNEGVALARTNSGRSKSRTRPPAPTRRSTSMVFLSVGVFFTFARWSGSQSNVENGKVDIAWSNKPMEVINPPIWPEWSQKNYLPQLNHLSSSRTFNSLSKREYIKTPTSLEEENEDIDWKMVIGRASAWVMTTLYLSSRMPQLWKNYRRRSVEGLSMLLFVMAFVGNSFYVLSIVVNPLVDTPGYLLESTPYLLGSGGTLCFDLAIVIQSFLYSPKRKALREKRRRGKGAQDQDYERLLLNPEHELEYEETPATNGNNSRSVSRSVSVHSKSGEIRKHRRESSIEGNDLKSIGKRISLEMVGEVGESGVTL